MNSISKFTIFSVGIAAATVLLQTARAQNTVQWSPIQNISGDSDVYTPAGSDLVYAYYFTGSGSSSYTVNGVTFEAFAVAPNVVNSAQVGDVSMTSGSLLGSNSPLVTPVLPEPSETPQFNNLSEPYQGILNGVVFSDPSVTLTLGGLTSGQSYFFQYWLNDSSGESNPFETYIDTGANSPYLVPNTSGAYLGLGQYIVGSFTVAEGESSYSFTLTTYDDFATASAIQVRTVPEPGSVGLLGLAALTGTVASQWRRRKHADLK